MSLKVIFSLCIFFNLRGIVFKNNSKIEHITSVEIFSFLKVETLYIKNYNFKVYIEINSLWRIYRRTVYIFTSEECRYQELNVNEDNQLHNIMTGGGFLVHQVMPLKFLDMFI